MRNQQFLFLVSRYSVIPGCFFHCDSPYILFVSSSAPSEIRVVISHNPCFVSCVVIPHNPLLFPVAASWRMRKLHLRRNVSVGVEQTLALISLTGLTAFACFNIAAARLSPPHELARLTIASNVLMLLQAFVQVSRSPSYSEQSRKDLAEAQLVNKTLRCQTVFTLGSREITGAVYFYCILSGGHTLCDSDNNSVNREIRQL